VGAALSFTDLPSRVATPNTVCNSIPWNYETTSYRFTDDDNPAPQDVILEEYSHFLLLF
jgi:hypothetical protein